MVCCCSCSCVCVCSCFFLVQSFLCTVFHAARYMSPDSRSVMSHRLFIEQQKSLGPGARNFSSRFERSQSKHKPRNQSTNPNPQPPKPPIVKAAFPSKELPCKALRTLGCSSNGWYLGDENAGFVGFGGAIRTQRHSDIVCFVGFGGLSELSFCSGFDIC